MKLVGQNDANNIGIAITNVTGGASPFSRSQKRFSAFSRVAPILEFSLAAIVGFGAILLLYTLFAPLPTPQRLPIAVAPADDRRSVLSSPGKINPFREIATVDAAAPTELQPLAEDNLEETDLNLSLHGAWVDELGGTAIIRTPSGEQMSFRIGDDIWNGVTLDGVYLEQVTILRNGVRETLSLVNRDPANASATRGRSAETNAVPEPSSSSRPTSIDEIVSISASRGENGFQLVLNPGSNPNHFKDLGLRSGDVLVSFGGRRISANPALATSMLRELAPGATVDIVVSRDGVPVPLEIRVPGQ